jgi:hypothetical protein
MDNSDIKIKNDLIVELKTTALMLSEFSNIAVKNDKFELANKLAKGSYTNTKAAMFLGEI